MSNSEQDKLSLEEKSIAVREAAEKLNKLMDEEYNKIKKILDNNSSPADEDFTLTVGIQNAYLG